MTKHLFFILLFTTLSITVCAKDSYFRGFYHGKNVFVRNPYLEETRDFCIEKVYLNGALVVENPKASAFEIDMNHLEVDTRVVIRIVHKDACKPELTNPEIIEKDLQFAWLKVYVDENEIMWITTKESKKGFYIVEKEDGEEWLPMDTARAKGDIFFNQHNVELKHDKGDNLYRVRYHEPEKEVAFSETFNFYSDKEEISHAVDEDKWIIEFTQEVSYLLYNKNGRIIRRGTGVSCNIRKLANGRYMIKYDGKEIYFDKK